MSQHNPLEAVLAILSNSESYRPEALAFARQHGHWPTSAEMAWLTKAEHRSTVLESGL